ncbi:MAG: IPTL-CTERM sorting domain-containing protein [Saprospiraceae bacterium]|nr:IPTL-CTERM sorting domain-containing protein [Saprospiraceae bacterium]
MKKLSTTTTLYVVGLFMLLWNPFSIAQTCSNVSGSTFTATIGTPATPTSAADFNYLTGTQLGRIFRDGVASTCAAPKACPGDFNTGTSYNYDSYSFVNNSASAECIVVDFNTGTCGTNVHGQVFLGSYTPSAGAGQLCGNNTYLGDVGSSVTQPFEVNVPAGATFTVVMTNTSSQQICDYSFTLNPSNPGVVISGAGCGGAAVPTMGQWGLIILALLTLSFGTVFLMRSRMAVAGAGNVSMGSGIPFDKSSYGKMLAAVMASVAVVFAVAVAAFGYEMTSADVPGSLLAGPVLAYLLHLLVPSRKEG